MPATTTKNHPISLYIFLGIWLAIILLLSLNEVFIPEIGQPPGNILIAGITPISLFLLLFILIKPFRQFILSLDMRLLILLHSWRMLGMGFVMLYVIDQLPPLFAFLAGFGDSLAAISAVIIGYALFTSTKGVSRLAIKSWNTFGLLDFIVAISVGILTQTNATLYDSSGVSSDLMTVFPFVIIPCFIVPLLAMTHIIIFLQLHYNFKAQQTIFLNN